MLKKWIYLAVIIFIGILAATIKIYVNATGPVKTAEAKALTIAKKQIQFSKVQDFHIYNGLERVFVIEGKNKKGEKVIVWIPEKSKKVIIKKAKNGLSKQEAIQKLKEESNPKKIISVRLGMEKNIPLWEIYYRSDNNLINYYYIHFETGEWLKKIENL
ncbi:MULTISPECIES: cell wall elongation regulator TseB-like domain-containing protein [Bacillaceae]|uniref:cell wall elongation regulator TseB-like domain-containing protein n=1 Tax=Bacillaceae TaxID=186817 RepID=UPI002FFF4D34